VANLRASSEELWYSAHLHFLVGPSHRGISFIMNSWVLGGP